jgi:UrcA family protein
MTKIFIRLVAGLFATTLVSGIAAAQNMEEITVTASREVETTKTIGMDTSTGWLRPMVQVSLSSAVSYADLDLTSQAGASELEKRVNDTAKAVCKGLRGKYPDATPSEADCAKAAANKAMVNVHKVEAAAVNKSAK